MNFLYKLEKKIGKYAIRDLTKYVIISFALGYMLQMFAPSIYNLFPFDAVLVFGNHEYWRIFTWIFTAPGSFGLFSLLMLCFYYMAGNRIENVIGRFRYNIYIFGGLFLSTVGVLIAGWISVKSFTPEDINYYIAFLRSNKDVMGYLLTGSHMTYYMTLSIFLTYAYIYSDAIVYLFFMIPFKIKWLAIFDLIMLAYEFKMTPHLIGRVTIVSCILNFLIFYIVNESYRRRGYRNSAYMKRKQTSKRKKSRFTVVDGGASEKTVGKTTPQSITKHKCAICGRSERDGDELEFRFCSKCNGNYEYCNEHLYTHEHIK